MQLVQDVRHGLLDAEEVVFHRFAIAVDEMGLIPSHAKRDVMCDFKTRLSDDSVTTTASNCHPLANRNWSTNEFVGEHSRTRRDIEHKEG